MKKTILLLSIILYLDGKSQGTAGFVDDRNFFYAYSNGNISKLEYIAIDTFYSARNYLTYFDNVGNFKLYVNQKKSIIFPTPPDRLSTSNFLLAYQRGTFVGVFNGKEAKRIAPFVNGTYKMGDSLIAFLDNFNMLKVYTYDTITELMLFTDADSFDVSDNMVVFTYQFSIFNAFYRGKIRAIENYIPTDYKLARDVIAYNDYLGNFKIYEYGISYNLENYVIDDYEVGNGLVVYSNNVDEWSVFSNGIKTKLLSMKPKTHYLKRNILAYTDNSDRFFVFYKGKLNLLENFSPKKVAIWDDILAYEDLYGTIWGFYKGEKVKISNNIALDWNLQNQCVVYYDIAPSMKTVWNDGVSYQYSAKSDK